MCTIAPARLRINNLPTVLSAWEASMLKENISESVEHPWTTRVVLAMRYCTSLRSSLEHPEASSSLLVVPVRDGIEILAR